MAQSVVFSRRPAAGEFVTPLGIPQKVRFGNGKRRREGGRRGTGEGHDHMLGDVSGREPSPPPPDQRYHHQAEGRHFGLQSVEFLTSVVERSAFGSRTRRSEIAGGKSRISNKMDCPLP